MARAPKNQNHYVKILDNYNIKSYINIVLKCIKAKDSVIK